jgi:CubicO group peptidase (beta-lactamase class C family)
MKQRGSWARRTIAGITALVVAAALAVSARQDWPAREWPVASPAAVGLDAASLTRFDADIASGKYGHVDGMLVIRRGRMAFERAYKHDYDRIYGEQSRRKSGLNANDATGPYNYYNPWWHPYYRRGELHTLQSVTKTITSIVIGIAVTRGEFPSLDTSVLKYFDTAKIKNVDDRKRRLTLRHLLTMTTGMDWREDLPYNDPNNTTAVMEASFDWLQVAIDAPMVDEPGTTYRYNSGATQILSHVFTAATGQDIEEYANRHLFTPLGITQFYWKRSPTGLVDTEGGLYLRPRDLARIWYLFLRNGVWEGRTIVSPVWVRESVTPAIAVNARGVQYGYKWWLYPYGTEGKLAWAGSGFGGQFPIAIPEHDLIVVINGWNILPGGAGLSPRVAIDRVLDALVK